MLDYEIAKNNDRNRHQLHAVANFPILIPTGHTIFNHTWWFLAKRVSAPCGSEEILTSPS